MPVADDGLTPIPEMSGFGGIPWHVSLMSIECLGKVMKAKVQTTDSTTF